MASLEGIVKASDFLSPANTSIQQKTNRGQNPSAQQGISVMQTEKDGNKTYVVSGNIFTVKEGDIQVSGNMTGTGTTDKYGKTLNSSMGASINAKFDVNDKLSLNAKAGISQAFPTSGAVVTSKELSAGFNFKANDNVSFSGSYSKDQKETKGRSIDTESYKAGIKYKDEKLTLSADYSKSITNRIESEQFKAGAKYNLDDNWSVSADYSKNLGGGKNNKANASIMIGYFKKF